MKKRHMVLAALFCATALFAGTSSRNTPARDTILDTAEWDGLCEISFIDASGYDTTGTAGFETITNFAINIVDTGFSATVSNITPAVTGRYQISSEVAFNTDTASQITLHVYTNGVPLVDSSGQDIGWHRTQSNSQADGVVALERVVTLAAGSVVDLRIDSAADETIMWHSGSFLIEKR